MKARDLIEQILEKSEQMVLDGKSFKSTSLILGWAFENQGFQPDDELDIVDIIVALMEERARVERCKTGHCYRR